MLNGRSVLIIEQEFLIALDIQRILEQAETGRTVFARSLEEAARLEGEWSAFDIAIIDTPHDDMDAHAMADALRSRGVGVVVSTGDLALRRRLSPEVPVVVKPFNEADLLGACARALKGASEPA
ncbi:response regulator [Arsenicitalea aurantiaca]|uniref:Response regulator n=1 Tax=Arsenicitalea aurantiaca TaxID=1783274 RepID=A0A433XLJ5_9HYPH|nr:response regulator [Arsenicitalea aurantiaca]RUT34894.1 response regulator [Arsenicitalea aurantiaca]